MNKEALQKAVDNLSIQMVYLHSSDSALLANVIQNPTQN